LKALVAYTNSSLATYILFLTASTWGIERERVILNELLSLPGLIFEMPEPEIGKLEFPIFHSKCVTSFFKVPGYGWVLVHQGFDIFFGEVGILEHFFDREVISQHSPGQVALLFFEFFFCF